MALGISYLKVLCVEPLLSRNTSLPQQPREQIRADVLSVRIRKDEPHRASDHELMPAADERSVEAEIPQAPDQVPAGDSAQPSHAILRGSGSLASPIAGGWWPWEMLKKTQSSIAACRFRRHSSRLCPVAQTPWRPGTSP